MSILRACLSATLLLPLAGCPATVRYQTVEVPVRIACITTVTEKPALLTPCGSAPLDADCVLRSGTDIARLSSALDQAINLLKACQ